MPANTRILRTGARVIEHTCEMCSKDAGFGFKVEYTQALKAYGRNQVGLATQLLGKWYCYEHRTEGEKCLSV